MIAEDFQNGIVQRLATDAWFTRADAVDIRALRVGYDPRKEVQDALKERGLLGRVGFLNFQKDYRTVDNEFVFATDVEFFVNPKINATKSGETGRDGQTSLWKSFALLHNFTIPISDANGERVDPFSKLQIVAGGYLGEREGVPVFGLKLQTRIYIETLAECLANPDGFFLVTENNQPLLVSPTDP